MTIPEDSKSALAYMDLAVQQLMVEQDFKPQSEEEASQWLEQNINNIVQRASDLQQDLYQKFLQNQQPISSILGLRIWLSVQRQRLDEIELESIRDILK